MTDLKKVLMQRDGMTSDEADDAISEAREMIAEGMDPEDVLADEFGLEPDYFYDLF